MLADPVPALFALSSALNTAPSRVKELDTLPALSPTVIATRLVPRAPLVVKHRTPDSDSHAVASHPVAPNTPRLVIPAGPNPAPCTVTLLDPVPPRFALLITLMPPASAEYAPDTLPARPPTVIAKRAVPLTP